MRPVPFDKIHMERLRDRNRPPITPILPPGRTIADFALSKISTPTYEHYRSFLDRVGSHLGWSSRRLIQDRDAIERLLFDPLSELLELTVSGTSAGYSVTKFTSPLRHEAEIQDFGLFPEHTGRGYGSCFVPLIILRLEDVSDNLSRILVCTRSTNGPQVPTFYSRFGFSVSKIVHHDATEH
jgi:ribosomal protein S18 acetylase RimI-like enzyme